MSSESAQSTIERKNELMTDITKLRAQVEDGLAMGDSMFGQFAHVDVTNEVNKRLSELKIKKETLENKIREKEALIQRSNRDFSDVKDTLPETHTHPIRRRLYHDVLTFIVCFHGSICYYILCYVIGTKNEGIFLFSAIKCITYCIMWSTPLFYRVIY
jgi:hypothetical protein